MRWQAPRTQHLASTVVEKEMFLMIYVEKHFGGGDTTTSNCGTFFNKKKDEIISHTTDRIKIMIDYSA